MSDYLFYQSSVTLPTIDHAKGIYAWDHTLIAPPLITTQAQCDEIVALLDQTFAAFAHQQVKA